jgi:hypothetical protein
MGGGGGELRRLRVVTSAVVMLVCCAGVLLCSCVSPAIERSGYRGKVGHSAQKMVGIIGSAQLAAQLDLHGRMLSTVTDEIVSEAEQDAQSVLTSLDSVQPPDGASVKLRDAADQVLQNAASELSDLRIAERRHDTPSIRKMLAELSKSLADVQKLQDST